MSGKVLTEYQRAQKFAYYKQQTAKGLREADTILKTLPLLDALLDSIENIEKAPMYRQKVKQHGNAFKSELVRSLGFIHNADEATQKQAYWVMDQVEKVDELISNTHTSKFPLLIKLLERFHELDEADVDSFVKNITTRQYALITEFVIDKKIINKLKNIMPLIEQMPVVQIAQQITKEQLQNTKGFGEESIKVLEEVFSTSGIKW
jgi:hypothetical protein